MALGLMATKVGMAQIFVEDGVRVPVTILKVDPNTIVQKRTMETDGYTAVQVGYGSIREKLVNKAKMGHFAKAKVAPSRSLVEFRANEEEMADKDVGSVLDVSMFAGVQSLDISGVSKGKGFAGVMKRHNFKGFRATHGTHEYFRHGGSIGCRAKPGKVFKGKKMAGQMGNERVTTINLRIIQIDTENNLIMVRGAVPGSKNCVVELRASARKARALHGVGGAVVEEGLKNPMKASKAKK